MFHLKPHLLWNVLPATDLNYGVVSNLIGLSDIGDYVTAYLLRMVSVRNWMKALILNMVLNNLISQKVIEFKGQISNITGVQN